MKKIIKLDLVKGVLYFDPPPNSKKAKTSLNADEGGIMEWYRSTSKEFKDKVLRKPLAKHKIIRVGFYINEDQKVLITSANYNKSTNRFRSPCVVSKDYLINTTTLEEVGESPEVGELCILYWKDAVTNFGLGAVEDILNKSRTASAVKVGFLLQKNEKELYIAPHKNIDREMYREVLVVPTRNISTLHKLEEKS